MKTLLVVLFMLVSCSGYCGWYDFNDERAKHDYTYRNKTHTSVGFDNHGGVYHTTYTPWNKTRIVDYHNSITGEYDTIVEHDTTL